MNGAAVALRSAVVVVAVGVGGAACGLSTDTSTWRAEVSSDGGDGTAVSFCPVTGPQGTPAASFVPDTGAFVAMTSEDDDIYTFAQLGSQTGALSTAMFEVFGGTMAFDLGPIGLAYDDGAPVVLTIGGVPVERAFVDGQRKADDEVELRYRYTPSCTEVTLGDGSTCTCGADTLTWRFTGAE